MNLEDYYRAKRIKERQAELSKLKSEFHLAVNGVVHHGYVDVPPEMHREILEGCLAHIDKVLERRTQELENQFKEL